MEAFFLVLMKLSLTACLLIPAVLALRLIFRKAPRWVFCLLWGIVGLRLLIPFSVESPFSLVPEDIAQGKVLRDTAAEYVGNVDRHYEGSAEYAQALEAGLTPVYSGDGYYVVTEQGSMAPPATVENTVVPVLSRIWLVGAVLMLGYMVASFWLLKSRLATATLLSGNLRRSEAVGSPFVLGLFRPGIYLPYGLEGTDLENVVAHERSHIRRGDHLWKPLGFLVLSVYWFHPLVWLGYILLCRDIEGACDEKVIRGMDRDQVRDYSRALLNCSIHRRAITACPLAFGETGVKERIKRVMDYKKPAFRLVILALAASVITGALLLTDPVSGPRLLMGADYRTRELLYTNKQETVDIYSHFCITADYRLYMRKQDSDSWLRGEKMEAYPLSREELEEYTGYDGGWHRPYRVGRIEDAYILRVENGFFYLAFRTRQGDTLLGFGKEDPEAGTQLRYLYRLESELRPHGADFSFLDRSLVGAVGVAECFEYFETEKIPGFAVAGFLSGCDGERYTDMGYAVFQTDGSGFRLLNHRVYEGAALEECGIWYCEDPAVLSLDGELRDETTFDVILSCNENLDLVQQDYYRDGEMIMQAASQQLGSRSMTLFSWGLCPEANSVTRRCYDRNGQEIPVVTTREKLLALVDEILYNPDIAQSSNPYDYIEAKKDSYNRILDYGSRAVACFVEELRSSDGNGLREYIMAAACSQLTQVGLKKGEYSPDWWASGQEWLDLWEKTAPEGAE